MKPPGFVGICLIYELNRALNQEYVMSDLFSDSSDQEHNI